MNKNTSPIASTDFFNQEYIPTTVFMEYMAKANVFPYKSKLSMEPFLERLHAMASGKCQYTSAAIDPILDSMHKKVDKKVAVIDEEQVDTMELELMFSTMFPSMFLEQKLSFVAPPFKKSFSFRTPMAKMFFDSGDWMMKVDTNKHKENLITSVTRAGVFLLKKFYNVRVDQLSYQVITLKNIKTGIEKHFEIEVKSDYVEATKLKPLKKLSKQQITKLLNNIHDEALWLEAFPPDHFSFKGFMMGTFHDVTAIESMSILKNKVTLAEDEMKPEFFFPFVEQQLKNYLSLSDIRVGMVMVAYSEFFQNEIYSLSGSNDISILNGSTGDHNVYEGAFTKNAPLLFSDITQIENDSKINKKLLENKIQSLILLPIFDEQNQLSSIIEIGVPEAMTFSAITILQLKDFFELMYLGSERYLRTLNNQIRLFIQQQFTSVHSSVEWKFEEVATKYEIKRTLPDFDGTIDPIVFQDIYPLYGQADIVSSSTLRNKSIQEDLIDNLERVLLLMNTWNDHVQFHLMESYILKVEGILKRIRKEFISSDESVIVELLTREINPLLTQLSQRYAQLPLEPFQDYINYLDHDLNIVYNKRKDYEQSVSILNSTISNFLEKDDRKMQKILPHYFEKYKTDGVEYNMYIGNSILKDGGFQPFYLKDFRIWQLVNACEITRLVEELAPTLKVPLKTAQLLFVYNNSLSIRFRMDEKQFDVDGSYNVRYEILKKRIDKAVIKGTGERLTVAGKIAIVYLQDKDRLEYLEYLDYLVQKGYITPDIEVLELDKLQGAEGLKALRVTVTTPQ